MTSELLNRIRRTGAILAMVSAAFWLLTGWWNGVSALSGSLLGLANLAAMQFMMGRIFEATLRGESTGWSVVIALKFVALGLLIFMAISVAGLAAVPFTCGVGVVIAAMIIESLRWTDESDATGLGPVAAPFEGG